MQLVSVGSILLEYVTKDHIAMHTILFKLKMALLFSFLVA